MVVTTDRGMSRIGSLSGGTGGPQVETGQGLAESEQFGLLEGGEEVRTWFSLRVQLIYSNFLDFVNRGDECMIEPANRDPIRSRPAPCRKSREARQYPTLPRENSG
jgi:hypothetical protein